MKLSAKNLVDIKNIIKSCINQTYTNDIDLILNGGMEQSVSFRFALYLNDAIKNIDYLKDLSIDIEYNKNGSIPKRTPRRLKGSRPDIIIHKRGDNTKNILVFELKGWWNKSSRKKDRIKLEDFTNQEGEYKYNLGVLIDLNKSNSTLEYYINSSLESKIIIQ